MTITVYSKTVCQPCRATKRKLTDVGLPFDAVNVDETPEAADYLIEKGYRETPVVELSDGRRWTGYRPDLITALAAEVAA
jgi:glutaredoxin-like protein NrdH